MAIYLPDFLDTISILNIKLWQWGSLILFIILAYLGGALLQWCILKIANAITSRTKVEWDKEIIALTPGPLRLIITLILFNVATKLLDLPLEAQNIISIILHAITVMAISWFLIRFIKFATQFIEKMLTKGVTEPIVIRSVSTRISVLRSILNAGIVLFAGALILLQFNMVRSLGVSMLASAGLASIVVGLASQRSLSNVFAGIQLSIAQPIRIGDSVVFENEWGWIEEITLTYVVIRIWDLRRLVVPINYLLEHPIQNWTKFSPNILGTVYLYADYTVDVEYMRKKLAKILEGTDLWDRQCPPILQVTELKEKTVELRALVSAADAEKAWDLRCYVREKLLQELQQAEGGKYLPQVRVELNPASQLVDR